MTLEVPLAVRVGGRTITREVSGVTIRKEAVGGVKSIQCRLFRPLDHSDPDLAPLSKVCVQDRRSALRVAEGRLSNTGRAVGSDGQAWEMTAFGPGQHASDITRPLIYIDRSLDGWEYQVTSVGDGPSFDSSPNPPGASAPGLVAAWADGTVVATSSLVAAHYQRIRDAGQKLGSYSFTWDAGLTNASWNIDTVASTDGNWGVADTLAVATFNVAGGTNARRVVTDFANGRNEVSLRTVWTGGASTVAGDLTYATFTDLIVRALILDKTGAEITSSIYTNPHLLAHNVVEDLLGRVLAQFDGASASVDQTGTFPIKQMAYPDGITAEQVLTDLMQLEPGYFWTTGPSTLTGNGKYTFAWKAWPTTVRYEATLDDGGEFPGSTLDLYNRVAVRYKDAAGRVKTAFRPSPTTVSNCPILNAQGIIRQGQIDLSDELGIIDNANEAGDNFLADHRVPKNAGTITIDRPVRDLYTGGMVQPWEIEPANLIRVRGVESFPDSLNASSNDGQTIFRIWTSTYTSESNSALLELDSDSLTMSNALHGLITRRDRKQ